MKATGGMKTTERTEGTERRRRKEGAGWESPLKYISMTKVLPTWLTSLPAHGVDRPQNGWAEMMGTTTMYVPKVD